MRTVRRDPSVDGSALEFTATNKWEDCKKLFPRPDVILDCGANIGQTAVNLRQAYPGESQKRWRFGCHGHARVAMPLDVDGTCPRKRGHATQNGMHPSYPQATIYCFEPVKSLFEQLQRRAESLQLQVRRLAVSDVNRPATMYLTRSPESNSLLPYLEAGNPLAGPHQVIGEESVHTVRLDDWCLSEGVDAGRVDLLKMDVQGSELDALKGAATILQSVALVLLEVAFVPFYQGCPLYDDIERFMAERGFACRSLYRSARPDIWADALFVPTGRTA